MVSSRAPRAPERKAGRQRRPEKWAGEAGGHGRQRPGTRAGQVAPPTVVRAEGGPRSGPEALCPWPPGQDGPQHHGLGGRLGKGPGLGWRG